MIVIRQELSQAYGYPYSLGLLGAVTSMLLKCKRLSICKLI